MRHSLKTPQLALCALALFLCVPAPVAAQTITTGNIAGTVEDQQGGRVPAATVQAVHVATGTTYQTLSQADGRFSILNVRVGVYTVKTSLSGSPGTG